MKQNLFEVLPPILAKYIKAKEFAHYKPDAQTKEPISVSRYSCVFDIPEIFLTLQEYQDCINWFNKIKSIEKLTKAPLPILIPINSEGVLCINPSDFLKYTLHASSTMGVIGVKKNSIKFFTNQSCTTQIDDSKLADNANAITPDAWNLVDINAFAQKNSQNKSEMIYMQYQYGKFGFLYGEESEYPFDLDSQKNQVLALYKMSAVSFRSVD